VLTGKVKTKYQNGKIQSKVKEKHLPQRTQRNNCVKKEKTLRTQRKKIKTLCSLWLKKPRVERGGLCVFLFILLFKF